MRARQRHQLVLVYVVLQYGRMVGSIGTPQGSNPELSTSMILPNGKLHGATALGGEIVGL